MRTRVTALLLILASCLPQAQAQDASEADELSQFLALLNQQTTLATNSRLNADYVPGMISVLGAEQLQGRGFRSLFEALAIIPGVITTMNETGARSVSVRGLGGIFEPGKVKLLLNGKAINASASATTGTLYDTPVEQIERVEFIRGPGSAIHGEFAYAGVLNVITHRQGEAFSGALLSEGGASFSGLLDFGDDGNYQASLNLAASQGDGEDIDSGADRTPGGISAYAPGQINNRRDFVSAIIDFESGQWQALLQLQQARRGDHFGSNQVLPPASDENIIAENLISASLAREFEVDEKLDGEWSASLLRISSDKDRLFLGVAPVFGGFASEDDIYADSRLTEQRFETAVKLHYDADDHQLFGQLVYAHVSVEESSQAINLDPVTNLPSPTVNAFPGPVDSSQERSSISLVLQDEYLVDEDMTLTSGLRLDDYQDIGNTLSPRIAIVWRRSPVHTFKAQLARAFRPPSLIETGGSLTSSIDVETNDTIEFGHIYQQGDRLLRNTLYFSRLRDLIAFQSSPTQGYYNSGRQNLSGYEFEIEETLTPEWEYNASLSLQNYSGVGRVGATPWMLKAGVDYRPAALTRLGLQLIAIGEREREAGDSRTDFEQTSQLDLNLEQRKFLGIAGLSFRGALHNLLDQRLAHPSAAATYADDYPYSDGTTLWLQLAYQP